MIKWIRGIHLCCTCCVLLVRVYNKQPRRTLVTRLLICFYPCFQLFSFHLFVLRLNALLYEAFLTRLVLRLFSLCG